MILLIQVGILALLATPVVCWALWPETLRARGEEAER